MSNARERDQDLRAFIQETFAFEVGLARTDILTDGLTMADVVRQSPKIVNSVDLMECFARTSNAVRKKLGIRVRLPAYPLDTPITTIVDAFIEQVAQQRAKELLPNA